MIDTIKTALKLLKRNWSSLLWFEILYRTVNFIFIYPFLYTMLLQALKAAKASYISQENIMLLLKNPLSVMILLLLLILFSLCVYLELSAFILCFEASWQGKHISLATLCLRAFKNAAGLFHYRNILLFVVLVPLFAISFFRVSSSILSTYRIPEFIMDFIRSNTMLFFLFAVLILGINLYVFFFLFSLSDVVLRHSGLKGAIRSVRQLLKKKKLRTILSLLLCLAGLTLLILLAATLCILVLYGWTWLFYAPESARYTFRWQLDAFVKVGGVLLEILYTAVVMAIIVTQYHIYREERPLAVARRPFKLSLLLKKSGILLLTFLLFSIYSESEIAGISILPLNPATEVVAHRAGAAFAPENTLAALDQAIQDRADWAEIDLQQTKDGVLIVMHDSNFKRISGYQAQVWDTDYEVVKTLDAGSYFGSRYAGEKIPTLEEMLIAAKNRINLMVELKYTGHEQNLVEKTIELIRKYQMEEQCMIVSMNMEILQTVKTLDPKLKTAYVTALLLTDNYNLNSIDGYSVETSNLSYAMVVQAHFQKKKVYAWTANSQRTITTILNSQADGIITDNPLLARYCLEDGGELSLTDSLVDFFYPPEKRLQNEFKN